MLKCPDLEEFVVKDLFNSGGLEFLILNGALSLSPINEFESVLADNLLVLTQTCKINKQFYSSIQIMNICPDLTRILRFDNKFLKIKVCNLIGQMCKHSDFFYSDLKKANVFPEMIKLCHEEDLVVKKASSFAIGNAAYYSDYLYDILADAIPPIVLLLKHKDDRIKTNSIGTISNLTRNSDILVNDIIENNIPLIFIDMLLYDSSLTVKKLVIHAFKNFFKHKKLLSALKDCLTVEKRKSLSKIHENPKFSNLHQQILVVQSHIFK